MKKIFLSVANILPYVLVIIFGISIILAKFGLPGGIKLFSVKTGSMSPKIETGALVAVSRSGNYLKGDIITFTKNGSAVTHRISEVKQENGQTFFQTKGDANDAPDAGWIGQNEILGKVIFSLPLVGFVISFAKSWPGLIFLIVLPAALIIYEEINNIKKQLTLRKEGK